MANTPKPKFPAYPKIVIATPPCVANFPKLPPDEPDVYDPDRPRFTFTGIFDSDVDLTALNEAAMKVAAAAFPTRKPEKVTVLLKDGDEYYDEAAGDKKKQENREVFRGRTYLRAVCASTHPPRIVGPDKQPLADGVRVFGGDLCRLQVQIIPSDVPQKGTITFRLIAVQLVEKRSSGGVGYDDSLFDDEGPGPTQAERPMDLSDEEIPF